MKKGAPSLKKGCKALGRIQRIVLMVSKGINMARLLRREYTREEF